MTDKENLVHNKSDADLAALARAGDKVAFGHLIERYQSMVYHIALRIVRNEYLAQELTQETLLQAYLSLDRLRDAGRFKSWLYGIALNVCKSHVRQQKMDFLSLESIMGGMRVEAALFSAAAPDPAVVVEDRDLQRFILDAVNSLSPKNRDATWLFYYQQLSIKEIAARLDISVVAVKGRLYKSRQRLKLELLSQVAPSPERRKKMIKVSVADVVKRDVEKGPEVAFIVVLLDEAGQRLLPIWVGPFEGHSIATILLEYSLPRPLTFTFMADLLKAVGAELEAVWIGALKHATYYATVKVRMGDAVREIDARPSDAINLALCMASPIYVAETVMEAEGVDISQEGVLPTGVGLAQIGQEMEKLLQGMAERQRSRTSLTQEERQTQAEESRQELVAFVLGSN